MTIRIEKSETPNVVETVELFELNGTSYHVPAVARPNVSIKYLKLLRSEGDAQAASYLLSALLSPEGLDALAEYDDLTDDQYRAIMKAARAIVMGNVVLDKS